MVVVTHDVGRSSLQSSLIGIGIKSSVRLDSMRFEAVRRLTEGGRDPVDTAPSYCLVFERAPCAAHFVALRTAARKERWEKRFVEGLGRAHRRLTVRPRVPPLRPERRRMAPRNPLARPGEVLAELKAADGATLAVSAVAIRLLGDIART